MKKILVVILALSTLSAYAGVGFSPDTIPTSPYSYGRCLPSPLPSPPFPFADWCGGPVIGEPKSDLPDYLTKAIRKARKKPWTKWNNVGIKIYGWVDVGVNGSTSKQTNSPMSYDFIPNRPVLDQVVLMVERDPDIEQTKHVDWGFLVNGIYGADYRYTAAKGYFSNQLLQHNNIYGWDPTQIYGLIYVPQVAQGMLIKIGRFISPSDIEAQWAPQNYLYSHSLMFTVDPYTYTGINTTIRLHPQFQFEFGVHGGNDMALWSNSAQPNGSLMMRWVSKDNKESLYGGVASIGSGQYKNGHDDLQQFVVVWGLKFSERVHMMTEAYYLWQFNAALGGTAIYGPVRYGQGGGEGPIIPGRSEAIGLVNYLQVLCGPKDYISIRNDALNDVQGQRTGFATWYTSHTLGWSHHFSDFVLIRPEVRYDHAWNDQNVTPYNGGTRVYQFTAAMDLCISF
jgi:hypothetical protein